MNNSKKLLIAALVTCFASYMFVHFFWRSHITQHAVSTQTAQATPEELAQIIEAGFALAEEGKYDAAIAVFNQALTSSLLTAEGRTKLVAALGDAYFSKAYTNETDPNRAQDWQRSMNYFQQALSMQELPAETRAFTEAKLGSMYLQAVNDSAPDEQKALEHLQRSLTIAELLPPERAITLTNIGSIYHNRNEQKKALEYYQEAIKIATELGAQNLIALLEKRIASLKK